VRTIEEVSVVVGRVVVGFDGSPGAVSALTWGAREADLLGVDLVAFAALDEQPPAPVPQPLVSDDTTALLDSLRERAQQFATDHPVVFRYGVGPAAQVLVDACQDDDLLVVGSRGRNPLIGLLLGSVSQACLKMARCPVVVVREQAEPPEPVGRVIVGVDASEPSRRALHIAAREADVRGAVLHAIHAVYWDQPGVELAAPATKQLVGWGKDLLKRELDGTGVTARPVVLTGHPSDVLVRHSKHADLLVLGSRGHSRVAGLFLGSTADRCARHASCPVLVVH
jgi:nucleotide-binding universal stress UspA family protein